MAPRAAMFRWRWAAAAPTALFLAVANADGVLRLPLERHQHARPPPEGPPQLLFDQPAGSRWRRSGHVAVASAEVGFPVQPLELFEETRLARGNFSVVRRPLNGTADVIYTVLAQVGTPGQQVRLVVDTGSSDLWVERGPYEPARSSSEAVVNGTANLVYGAGQVSGNKVRDLVCLDPSFCIKDQTLIAADPINSSALTGAVGPQGLFEGLLGLAYPGLSQAGGGTFLEGLMSLGLWPQPAFGLSLHSSWDPARSFVAFGDLQQVKAAAPPGHGGGVSLPVWVMDGMAKFWLVLGMVEIPGAGGGKILGALDSGTSFVAIPNPQYDWVMRHIMSEEDMDKCMMQADELFCPCDDVEVRPLTFTFPDLFDGKQISVTIQGKELFLLAYQVFTPLGFVQVCKVAVQKTPAVLPIWVFGDTFLRHVYAVFDVKGLQVVLFPQPPLPDPPALPDLASVPMELLGDQDAKHPTEVPVRSTPDPLPPNQPFWWRPHGHRPRPRPPPRGAERPWGWAAGAPNWAAGVLEAPVAALALALVVPPATAAAAAAALLLWRRRRKANLEAIVSDDIGCYNRL